MMHNGWLHLKLSENNAQLISASDYKFYYCSSNIKMRLKCKFEIQCSFKLLAIIIDRTLIG